MGCGESLYESLQKWLAEVICGVGRRWGSSAAAAWLTENGWIRCQVRNFSCIYEKYAHPLAAGAAGFTLP